MNNIYIILDMNKSEKVDMMMIIVIHRLILILFYKKWKNISNDDFIYLIYRFLVIISIRESDNFMIKSNITNIIMKLQWYYRIMIYKKILQKIERISKKKIWKKLERYIKKNKYIIFNSLY